MNGVELASLESGIYCAATQARGEQLPPCHDAVLTFGLLGNETIKAGSNAAFFIPWMENAALAGHKADRGSRERTRGAHNAPTL